MNKKILIVGITVLLLIVGLSGCTDTTNNSNTNSDTNGIVDNSDTNQTSVPQYSSSCESLIPKNVQDLTFVKVKSMDYGFIGAADGVKATYTDNKGNELEFEIYKFEAQKDAEDFVNSIDSSQGLDESQTANYNWLAFRSGHFGFYILGKPGTAYSQVETLAKATGYYT